MLKILRFMSLLSQALNLGLAFAHLVEMAPKRSMDGQDWLTTQRIYAYYGKVAALTIPTALLSTTSALVSARQRKPVASLTATGAVCMVATVGIWARFNEPVNQQVVAWAESGELPANWRSRRDQWEYAHAVSAALHAVGFAALLGAFLRDSQ